MIFHFEVQGTEKMFIFKLTLLKSEELLLEGRRHKNLKTQKHHQLKKLNHKEPCSEGDLLLNLPYFLLLLGRNRFRGMEVFLRHWGWVLQEGEKTTKEEDYNQMWPEL